jgi:hypothetical protein
MSPVTFSPFNMDPGSVIPDLIRDRGDGLLKEPGSSPAFFRHSCESRACPGLDPGNPSSSGRDGGRISGRDGMSPVTFSPFNMDPGSVIPDLIRDQGDGLLKEPGSSPRPPSPP